MCAVKSPSLLLRLQCTPPLSSEHFHTQLSDTYPLIHVPPPQLKVKAPSLLLQLQRTPPRAPGMMGPPPMAAMAPPPPSAAASPSKPFYT